MIEVKKLKKTFGDITALDGLNLSVRKGEIYGLLGPNGAGKSTFMNILSGYHDSEGGEIIIDSETYSSSNMAIKAKFGLVPQHIALYEELTALENLKLFGKLHGLRGSHLSQKIEEILELVELTYRKKDLVKGFSGGMKRRLNIAASLMHDPEIILCDEPTVGVDPQSRNAIFELLDSLNQKGSTIIYSTHYMEEAEKLCNRIGIIDHGSILAEGSLDELLERLPPSQGVTIKRFPNFEAHLDGLKQFGEITEEKESLSLSPNSDFSVSKFFAWVESQNLKPHWFRIKQPTLENLFLHLTGKDLRE